MAEMKFLRLPQVKSKTGLSRSSIYQRISEGKFPKPVSIGVRAVAWVDDDVHDWMRRQIERSRRMDGGPGSCKGD